MTRISAVELVHASPAHIGTIANRLREQDRIEAAAFGLNPKQALRQGLHGSIFAVTAKVNGRPEAMLGLSPLSLIEGRGRPWMLGTDVVFDHGRALVAWGEPIIRAMLANCPILENVIAASNVKAIRLLRRWGFEIGEEAEDISGVPFLPFRLDSRAMALAA